MTFIHAALPFVALAVLIGGIITLSERIGAMIAPPVSRFLGRHLPPARIPESIELPYGFNAAFWTDGEGKWRSAQTFEEWLSAQPDRFKKTEDTFFNRLAFERHKRRKSA